MTLRIGACLSLSGRYARFGLQAAHGLQAWCALTAGVQLHIEDDRSEASAVSANLRRLKSTSDLLIGPYSTELTREAANVASQTQCLLWNQGGAGDDAQTAAPGWMVSVLTPASKYSLPFLKRAALATVRAPVYLVHGRGRFGREATAGAQVAAEQLGLRTVRLDPDQPLPRGEVPVWDLFSAGSFDEDISRINEARSVAVQPRFECAVAAGVRAFGSAVVRPNGVFGVAQWFPGAKGRSEVGPPEESFLSGYSQIFGETPEYPAVQAAAAAIVASHCAQLCGETKASSLWSAAANLDTSTLFGRFLIDPVTGGQRGHAVQLVRWQRSGLVLASGAVRMTN